MDVILSMPRCEVDRFDIMKGRFQWLCKLLYSLKRDDSFDDKVLHDMILTGFTTWCSDNAEDCVKKFSKGGY